MVRATAPISVLTVFPLARRSAARQESRTSGVHMGQGFHGAAGLRGRTAGEVGRALHRSATDLGWSPDPAGELHVALVDAGDSVWVSAASDVIVSLAARMARTLGNPIRLYTVEVDGQTDVSVRCGGRTLRPDGGTDVLASALDEDVGPSSGEPFSALAEERLRVLLEVHEDVDHADRSRTFLRFAPTA